MEEQSNSRRPGEGPVASGTVQSNRRSALRSIGALTGLTAIGGLVQLIEGCGGGGDSAMPTAPPQTMPSLGAHSLAFLRLHDGLPSVSAGPMSTQASGSTILACVGRGDIATHALPTDNMGNVPYVQKDTAHAYTLWPTSGTALYAFLSAAGGIGHQVTAANSNTDDEVTLAVVEVKNGGVIQDVAWIERTAAPLTSATVTTTGPATLVAFWWGDDGNGIVSAVPGNQFTIVDSQLVSANAVECIVATKDVSDAGSYVVTWSATPLQGAQLWLVAVQKAP